MKKKTPFGEIEIFDAHTHFFSRNFFDTLISQSPVLSNKTNAIETVAELTGWIMPPPEAAKLAGLWKEEFDRHEISGAMMIASIPNDENSIAAAVTAYPDRIIGGFIIDPTKPETEIRGRRAFDDLQLNTACLFPAMFHFSMAECQGARAVVALASERPNTAVFVHCGALSVGARKKLGLLSKFDMRYSNPLDIYKLAAEFPKTKFIIPHFGAGMFRETLMLADLCPNVFIDTSSTNKWMGYETAQVDLATIFKRALSVIGHERILFGTDSSFFPRGWNSTIYETQIDALLKCGVESEEAQAILGGNLKRVYGIK